MNSLSDTHTLQGQWSPLVPPDLDQVMAIEVRAYSHPWSRGNFLDSMASGYGAWGYWGADDAHAPVLLAYFVAAPGVDEAHLLNFTVRPERQGHGLARVLMARLRTWSREAGAQTLWLEVRDSNARARSVYEAAGFETVGRRKAYYPAGQASREDAVVMKLDLTLAQGVAP